MENSEVGKIIIRKNKKGDFIFEVDLGGKQPMKIPDGHSLKDDSFNEKECSVFREKGQIKKIIVDENDILENRSVPPPTPKSVPNNNSSTKQEKVYADSFDISKTQVPKDTREVLKDFKEIDNFHLKLNKFAQFDEQKGYKLQKSYEITQANWDVANSKIQDYTKSIETFKPKSFMLQTSSPLLIGSEQSIYEPSPIRLHHIYGIPYIPASGIKGVVRSYIITEKFDSKEEEALKDADFVTVFGSQDHAGEVTFFDAFPTEKPTLKVDIMNPHYGNYYGDKTNKVAPTDTQNPVPVNFLTVENTTFRFMMGAKEGLDTFMIQGKKIEDWLTEALKNHGLGAKTAVGYGYF
jgi:CRISPR-associated protein Cmr6